MDLDELLAATGLAYSGDPPEVRVAVAGRHLHVRLTRESDSVVELAIALDGGGLVDHAATLRTPGDTRLSTVDGVPGVARRLVEPDAGLLYDAVHELAKTVARLAPATTQEVHVGAEPARPEPPSPERASAPLYWFYVAAPTTLHGPDRSVIGSMQPGSWYQALQEQEGWVKAIDDRGVEGWLDAASVNRQ